MMIRSSRESKQRIGLRAAAAAAASLVATMSVLTAVRAATCPTDSVSVGVGLGGAAPLPPIDGASTASRNLLGLADAAGGARVFPIHMYEGWQGPSAPDGGMPSGREAALETERMIAQYARAGFPILLTLNCTAKATQTCAAPDVYKAWIDEVLGRVGASVEAVEITNEANLNLSAATSDGPSGNALPDLVAGVIEAKAYAGAHGLEIKVGFNWAFDYHWPGAWPSIGPAFWTYLKNAATTAPAFLPSVDFVGEHTYPNLGSYATPLLNTTPNERDAIWTARTFMTSIGLPASVPIRVTEVGYPTSSIAQEGDQRGYYEQIFAAIDQVHVPANVNAVYAFLYQNNPSAATTIGDFGVVYPAIEILDGGDAAPPPPRAPDACAGPYGCLPGDPKPAYFTLEDAAAKYDPRPTGCPLTP